MKRYCDYDAIVHYKEGTFASQFADDMEGKLESVERDVLEPWETESFLDGKYETYISREPIVMYRLYGKYKKEEAQPVGAKLGGRFVSTEFAESTIDAKLRLALKPGWKNTKMYEAKLIVPAGTRLNIGIVAPVTMPSREVLPGGAPQIMLPENWPEEWVQGYRRVSGRQLQLEPTYWPEKPEEIIEGKTLPRYLPKVLLSQGQKAIARGAVRYHRLQGQSVYHEEDVPEPGVWILLVKHPVVVEIG